MAGGRRPKPTHLKIVEGNPGKRSLNRREPVPPVEPVEPPSFLSPLARAEWDRVVPILDKMHLSSTADLQTLACYCEAVADHIKARELLLNTTVLVKGQRGNLVKNPALQMARDAMNMIRMLAGEFGFTPSSRSRIELPGEDVGDLESILSG